MEFFHNFSPGTFPFKTKGFSSRRTKEKKRYNKKKRAHRFCTLVVARLSSSSFVLWALLVANPLLQTPLRNLWLADPWFSRDSHALSGGGVAPANQTKERSVHELFAGAFHLVNLFLTNLVRICGFSSLFSAIAVFLALSGKMC